MAFNSMSCRKCDDINPWVYFAPVDNLDGSSTCVCFDCASARQWVDAGGNIKEGVNI